MTSYPFSGESGISFRQRVGWPLAVAVVALSTQTFGCGGQQQTQVELTPKEEQALADTIESRARNLMATWSELKPEPYLRLFSDDVQFFYQGWANRAEFEKNVREIMGSYSEFPVEVTDARVEVLGRDGGVATLTYRSQPVDTAGQSDEPFEAAFTLVYERRDGNWKVVQTHESLIPQEDSQ